MIAPAPRYSSGCVADRLETSRRKVEIFLLVGKFDLVSRELGRMSKGAAYLKANFPPSALEMGPVGQ